MKRIKIILTLGLIVGTVGFRLSAQNTSVMTNGVVIDDQVILKWNALGSMEDKEFFFRGTEQAAYRIAWGDGDTTRVTGQGFDSTLRMVHRYKEAGSYTVTLYGERNYNYNYNYMETALGINMNMVYVGSGTFMMGCTDNHCNADEKPAHKVTLSSYGIGMYEVTQEQWEKVMGTTVHQQRDKVDANASLYGVGANYPMYYVNWEEAQSFCSKLSEASGMRYVLPTEAQWEYAARGGMRNSRNFPYSGSFAADEVAWCEGYTVVTHPVGELRANELGIYDMSGNVNEWCLDGYDKYQADSQIDPICLTGTSRVFRGGGFATNSWYTMVYVRNSVEPETRRRDLGFRVVCLP